MRAELLHRAHHGFRPLGTGSARSVRHDWPVTVRPWRLDRELLRAKPEPCPVKCAEEARCDIAIEPGWREGRSHAVPCEKILLSARILGRFERLVFVVRPATRVVRIVRLGELLHPHLR